MTRETKIGLLVGLAFIIVIGILLSDHLTTRGELPAAQLTQVGNSVQTAIATPASNTPPIAPVTVPTNVVVRNTIPTHDEINQAPATSIVQVSPPTGRTPVVIPQSGGLSINVGPATPAGGSEPATTTTPTRDDRIGQPLMVAQATTPLDGDPLMQKVDRGQTPAQAEAVAKNLKPVKADKGDTVSKFAAKYLGGNTSANRQAIIDANPDLKANPAKIVLGHTYMIPARAASTEAPKAAVAGGAAIPETVPTNDLSTKPEVKSAEAKADAKAAAKSAKSSAAHTTYTVKSNDTLWSIANGSPSLLKEIQDLNKDVLKGKTTVHPGVTLKIPAKTTVASR